VGTNEAVSGVSIDSLIYVVYSNSGVLKVKVFDKVTKIWSSKTASRASSTMFISQLWLPTSNTIIFCDDFGSEYGYNITQNVFYAISPARDVVSLPVLGNTIYYLPATSHPYSSGHYRTNPTGFVSVVNGLIYVEGYSGSTSNSNVYVYNTTGLIRQVSSIPLTLEWSGAVTLGNKIYVAGGFTMPGTSPTTAFYVYDTVADTWTSLGPLQYQHVLSTLVVG
jgi:hypothetical protein